MVHDKVLLTGISGFIAKHIALRLFECGYDVRGTVRSPEKAHRVREILAREGAPVERLELVSADLRKDTGWAEAAAGCRYMIHTASPFPARQSADKQSLVPPARDGTLRAISAAQHAGVERIVLTSSVAAITYGHTGRAEFGENDWSDPLGRSISAYAVSKTEAERAAWNAVRENGPELAVINPALVLGPLLDSDAGTSIGTIAMMMRGRLPAVPKIALGIVDVRDVAAAHVEAMRRERAAGRRFILSAGVLSMLEIARLVAEGDPRSARRVPRVELPDALVKLAAAFVPEARNAVPELGVRKRLDTQPAREVLEIAFRSPREAVAATTENLRRHGLIP